MVIESNVGMYNFQFNSFFSLFRLPGICVWMLRSVFNLIQFTITVTVTISISIRWLSSLNYISIVNVNISGTNVK